MVTQALNSEILRRAQGALESVRGEFEPPVRRLRERVRLMDAREPLDFDENAGTWTGWYTFAQGPVTVAGTAEGPVSYEDTPWWLHLGVTSDPNTDVADTWDFQITQEEDDLGSATIEHGAPDNAYVSTMVMVPEFTIRGDIDGDATWMFASRLMARSMDPTDGGQFTDDLALTEREFVRAAGTRLVITDDPADLGDPDTNDDVVNAKFISFSVTWNNAVGPKRFMEDVDSVSDKVDLGVRQITGQLRLEWEDNEEKAKYAVGTPRAIGIYQTGTEYDTDKDRAALIEIPNAYWLTPSDDPRNNNMTLTYGFRAYMDTTLGYPARIAFTNGETGYA